MANEVLHSHAPHREERRNKPGSSNKDDSAQQKLSLFQSKILLAPYIPHGEHHDGNRDYLNSQGAPQLFKSSFKACERFSSTLPATIVIKDDDGADSDEQGYSSSDSSSVDIYEDDDNYLYGHEGDKSLQDSYGTLWIQSPTRGAKMHLELDITSFIASLPKVPCETESDCSEDKNHSSFCSTSHGSFSQTMSFNETAQKRPSSAVISGTTSARSSTRSSRTSGTSTSRRGTRSTASAMAAASILIPKTPPKVQKQQI